MKWRGLTIRMKECTITINDVFGFAFFFDVGLKLKNLLRHVHRKSERKISVLLLSGTFEMPVKVFGSALKNILNACFEKNMDAEKPSRVHGLAAWRGGSRCFFRNRMVAFIWKTISGRL